ncbi:MAG: indolepyruvate ferredoxin oxidoreductase subunit alpha [Halanaerobiaceae bacterium]
MTKKLMLGNEAIARGAYEAGVTVASAYPGTPSTEITENIAEYDEIYSEWAPNEKVSLEVAIGAAIAGARAICAMKHVGLNVAADPLFTSSYTGINGGLVIVVADDPGMHSSQNEQDTRHYGRAAKLPVLAPSDSQESKDFVKKGFELSEKFDTPVMVRLSTRISHSKSIVKLGSRQEYELKDFEKDFQKYVMIPAMARKRRVVVEKRMRKLKEYANNYELNQLEWGNKEIGVITDGIAYQYAKEAMGDVSYLKLGMEYPYPDKLINKFAENVKKLYVIEELDPFIENHVKSLGLEVTGKDKLPIIGELSKKIIMESLKEDKIDNNSEESSSSEKAPEGIVEKDIPIRPPVMCPGCPHRGTFHILGKLNLNVTGDIGCYALGALPPAEAMDTCICMGASVSAAHGMEKARGKEFRENTVAVIGDSTFMHSGVTGLIDIVYNKGCSTIIILDNSTTGMTGHQENPTTGYTIKGEPTRQVDLVKLSEAIGISRIEVVDSFDLKTLEETVKNEIKADEPSIIISQRPCALLKTAAYSGYIKVDLDNCTHCRQCMKLGCPAIIDQDDHIEINEALCNGCSLCLEVCHFDALKKVGDDNE